MIVKNEEAHLPGCLESVADLVDEIVVVDTGSTDGTRAIAERFGARVVDFPWTEDFSAARNESLRHATGQWIFWLDADDRLDEAARDRLRALFAGLGDRNEAWLMRVLSVQDAGTGSAVLVDQVRLFPDHPEIRWQYPIHEQILPAIQRLGGEVRASDVEIRHEGYRDPEQFRAKLQRNLHILETARSRQPDDPVLLFQLAVAYQGAGQVEESVPLLRQSLESGKLVQSWATRAQGLLTRAYRLLGQQREAWTACQQGRAQDAEDVELLHEEALLRYGRNDLGGAAACLERLLERGKPDRMLQGVDAGLWGYRTRYKLGMIYRAQEKHAEAQAQWSAALQEKPDFTSAWVAMADLWVEQDHLPELDLAVHRLEKEPRLWESATLLRAASLVARNRFVAARRLLEGQLTAHPASLWLRLGLAGTLMTEGESFEEAARLLREVLERDPNNEDAREGLAALEGPGPKKRKKRS
jgi:tetratricopeptide (TPR) repeat protein